MVRNDAVGQARKQVAKDRAAAVVAMAAPLDCHRQIVTRWLLAFAWEPATRASTWWAVLGLNQ
jgi:hypothetical protein